MQKHHQASPVTGQTIPEMSVQEIGYSVQTWIATCIQDTINLNGQDEPKYYCWISTVYNAIPPVGQSANPSSIFTQIDTAIQTNDEGDPKIERIRQKLVAAIAKTIAVADPRQGHRISRIIRGAPLNRFCPEIWAVNLGMVQPHRRKPGQYPNEFEISDLTTEEFEIVVHGSIDSSFPQTDLRIATE